MSAQSKDKVNREAVRAALHNASAEGMSVADIAARMGVGEGDRARLRRLLARMTEQGRAERIGRGQYALPAKTAPAKTAPAKTSPKASSAKTSPKASSAKTSPKASSAKTSPKASSAKTSPKASSAKTSPKANTAKSAAPPAAAAEPPPTTPTAAPTPAAAVDPSVTGRITVHPAGYGFVELEDGTASVFIPARGRHTALDGDRVVLHIRPGYKGPEGRVIEVLSRGRAKLTGTLQRAGRVIYLEPDDPRIGTDYGHVPLIGSAPRSKVGQAAVVEICRYPTETRPELVGRLLRVLGPPDDPRTEIEKILAFADLSTEFPEDAERQAQGVPETLTERDLADRVDLRDRPFVSIDPETARDFDDALCVENGPHGGPRVWVAVADVSHYVRAGDALDREAAVRGVSVYLPDRVVPMLPLPLSAGICSLNPEVDRCAMVVRLDVSKDGRVLDSDLAAAVIRSHARLDYPGVAAALSGDFRGRRDKYRPWARTLRRLHDLAQAMRGRRRARGTLELDLAEPRVLLDDDDPELVRDVVRSKATEDVKQAYELVEEFMIAANEAVGRFFADRDRTAVWRVHAPPELDRLRELAPVLESFGIRVSERMLRDALEPPGMRRLHEAITEREASPALSFLMLRSLKQAVYDINPIGHFGLASPHYLHFTSPIRRYADLLVHRLAKFYLHREGKPSGGGVGFSPCPAEELAELAASVSEHERRALEVEREAVAMYRAYFMRDQVGEQFSGRISAVTSFGAFVEFDDPFVEGLIKLDALGADAFVFDAAAMRLYGRRSGFSLRLGDHVRVEVNEVSVARRRIDLRLVSSAGKPAPTQAHGEGARRSRRGQAGTGETRRQHPAHHGPGRSSGRRASGHGSKGRRRRR
ncbi:ribonuclease R [Haliangium sp.]|uniref:ribonuclease R n=1 Tax=Haliangium sp. TaxID=2663208 RepID=UPI003D0A190B